jgi:hypothetical protein
MSARVASLVALSTAWLILGIAACSSDDASTPAAADASTPKQDGSTPDVTSGDASNPDANSECGLVVPTTYDSPNYTTNAASELQIRARFSAFLQPMKDAEGNLAVVPTAASLRALYDAQDGGAPSLRSITTPYYAGKIDGWIDTFAAAAGNSWTPAEPPTGTGGKYGANIFTERGNDLRQAIEKGMFGAAMYKHALTILNGTLTEASVDRLVAIYGAHPSFPRNDKPATQDGGVSNPDSLIATYAKRRDPGNTTPPGLYVRIKTSLITVKAAIARGPACNAERDAAIASFKKDMERTLFATVIFYLNDSTNKFSLATPTPTNLAAALHGYGEAVGFIHGYRTLPATDRTITDAQVDTLLTTLGANPTATITSYKFVTDTATELPKFLQAIQQVTAIYAFSPQEVTAFKVHN